MKAAPLLRRRVIVAADAFIEVVVWRVSEPVQPSTHGFKYRLAYVVGGQCVLRYDNEVGKGDHRHTETREEPYRFSTPEQLMAEFQADVTCPHPSPGFVARRGEGAQMQGARQIGRAGVLDCTSSTQAERNEADAWPRDAAAGGWWGMRA